jgi:hypothetical protein
MKRLFSVLAFTLLALTAPAQNTPAPNIRMTGSGQVVNGTLTIKSGATLAIEGGASVTGLPTTDATLTAIAGLITSANKITLWTGTDTASIIDFTALAQTFAGYTTAAQYRNAIFPASGAEGDMITHDGTNWIRQAIGTTGQVPIAQADGTWIWDDISLTVEADAVVYDPATSGLTATDVQAAIDEVVAEKGDVSSNTTTTVDNELALFSGTLGKTIKRATSTGIANLTSGVLGTITASGILDTIGSTRGSVLYRGASGWAALTPGTSGHVFTSAGPGADPTWSAASGGGAALFAGRSAKSAAYTIVAADAGYLIENAGGGTYSFSFDPAATLGAGFAVGVYNNNPSSQTLTLDPNGSETIRTPDGTVTTLALLRGEGAILMCDGTGWEVVAMARQVKGKMPDGSAGSPSIYSTASATTGFFFPGSTQIGFSIVGTQVAEFDNVGLDVLGTTASTSTTTGSIRNAGGIGNAGIIYTQVPVELRTTSFSVPAGGSFATYQNTGATAQTVCTLPTAAANLKYTFIVGDTDGVRVTAASGDTIRIAGTVSGAAGYVENATIGSTLTLVAIDATQWIATAVNGTWTFSP